MRFDEDTKGFKWLPRALSELNSFASIRVIRWRTWLAGILILLLLPNAFADTDFSAFWKKFGSAVISGDKATVAEMTKFPLSMSYLVKGIKCFASAEPRQESARRPEIYCLFKETPQDWENAPIRFLFELTKSGWKFVGVDNINE